MGEPHPSVRDRGVAGNQREAEPGEPEVPVVAGDAAIPLVPVGRAGPLLPHHRPERELGERLPSEVDRGAGRRGGVDVTAVERADDRRTEEESIAQVKQGRTLQLTTSDRLLDDLGFVPGRPDPRVQLDVDPEGRTKLPHGASGERVDREIAGTRHGAEGPDSQRVGVDRLLELADLLLTLADPIAQVGGGRPVGLDGRLVRLDGRRVGVDLGGDRDPKVVDRRLPPVGAVSGGGDGLVELALVDQPVLGHPGPELLLPPRGREGLLELAQLPLRTLELRGALLQGKDCVVLQRLVLGGHPLGQAHPRQQRQDQAAEGEDLREVAHAKLPLGASPP